MVNSGYQKVHFCRSPFYLVHLGNKLHSERGLKFFLVQWHKIQKDEPLLKDGLEECTVHKNFYLSA